MKSATSRRGLVFWGIAIFILFIPFVESIGLSGIRLSPIIHIPGKSLTNHYFITDTSLPVDVALGGSFARYAQVTPVVDNQFELMINFPTEPIAPGTYSLSLSATEVAETEFAGIGSLTSVSKQFVVEVYSWDKEITASLSAPSVNENGTVHFAVTVQSRTYSDIDSVRAKITIFNLENVTLAEVYTNRRALPALGQETLTASFNTTGLRPGQYFAQALVEYDGRQKVADASFRIGTMELILLNYTQTLEQGFTLFQARVFNNWGNELRNVYAKLILQDQFQIMQPLLQTPSIALQPWQEGIVEGIVKIDFPAGEYNGTIQLFFEGEQKEESVEFIVIESISPEKVKADIELSRKNMIIQLLAIGVLILIVFILFLLKNTSRKSKLPLPLKKNEL